MILLQDCNCTSIHQVRQEVSRNFGTQRQCLYPYEDVACVTSALDITAICSPPDNGGRVDQQAGTTYGVSPTGQLRSQRWFDSCCG